MKYTITLFFVFLVFISLASNIDNYVVANADGYLLMHNNSSNISNLNNIPLMQFLLNRMGLGMMVQMTLSSDGLNPELLNYVFGKDVELVYQEKLGYFCAFTNSNITPKDYIEKFTPESSEIIEKNGYSYIKNGEDYVVFFKSGVFSFISGITPEKYMNLLKSQGVYKNSLPASNWISLELKLNSNEMENAPITLPNADIPKNKTMDLKATINIEGNEILLSLYANADIDAEIRKLIENSSNDKTWFSHSKYFGSGMYTVVSIDNLNSIFDYAEKNVNSNDKQLVETFRKYSDYFTGRAYIFVPLTIGDLLSSDNSSYGNFILSLQYNNSELLDYFNSNKSLSKSVKNGIQYYETTSDGTKTYIYVDNDNLDITSLEPDEFLKLLSSARTPVSVKSYNILRKYIQKGVVSFYWDIGEDLEKSMYLKSPFNESGVVMNINYRNGELQLLLAIH